MHNPTSTISPPPFLVPSVCPKCTSTFPKRTSSMCTQVTFKGLCCYSSYCLFFLFPPGPGEDIWQTAIRETLEETGIQTEFVSLLCFRHMHGYRWGIDDLYFACLLRPLSTDITISPSEIADAKWMDVSSSSFDMVCTTETS